MRFLRAVLIGFVILALASGSLSAQTLGTRFQEDYEIVDLGPVPGVPTPYGGLTFLAGDPDTLLIGGDANSVSGALYSIGVIRDESDHIIGFDGGEDASYYADAAYLDGGVSYGPGGVLFLARYPINEIGQLEPGSTTPDKISALNPLGAAPSVGGLGFVPGGFPGSGQMKSVSWGGGQWYTLDFSPDGGGTYDITAATLETTIVGGPEGFIYIPEGSPQFVDFGNVMVSEWSAGNVAIYDVDGNGDPIPSSRELFISGLSGAEGAIFDPRTGDFLFSTFGGGDRVLLVKGFAVPVEVCDGVDNDGDGQIDEGFDVDADGAVDCFDNCPTIANPDQTDGDGDGFGDLCDARTRLLEDEFDFENEGSAQTDYASFLNWDVLAGSVDLIGNGFQDVLPGNGLYVDLDGGDAAVLRSKRAFDLAPGEYTLKFKLGGSQQGDVNDVTVSLAGVYGENFSVPSTDPFKRISRKITVATAASGKLTFDHDLSGPGDGTGDEFGPLIDAVTLERTGELNIPLPSVSEEAPGIGTDSKTGSAVSGAGDLNPSGMDQDFDDFIAGAPGFTPDGGPASAGAAAVYLGSDVKTERLTPDIIFVGEAAHDRAGVAVEGDFDYDGNGIPDLLIGAEQVDRTGVTPAPTGAGKVYLIFFDPTDTVHYPNLGDGAVTDTVSLSLVGQPDGIPGVVFNGAVAGDQAGFSLAGGGRVHDPAFQDLAIGAPGRDATDGDVDAGGVYLIFGGQNLELASVGGAIDLARVANGLTDQIEGVIYEGAEAEDALGFSVAFPGDVVEPAGNEDLGMGAPLADTVLATDDTLQNTGSAYFASGGVQVLTGIIEVCDIGTPGATESASVPGVRVRGDQAGAQLGYSISGGGDNLQNGQADVLIGAPFYDRELPTDDTLQNTGLSVQTASLMPLGIIEVCDIGTPETDGAVEGAQYVGANADDQLGTAVAGVGDLTGDGTDDIALGAPFTDPNGLIDAGTLYIVEGSPDPGTDFGSFNLGIIEVCDIGGRALDGTEAGEQAGASADGTGDVDGDGDGDAVTGSPGKGANSDDGALSLILESEDLKLELPNLPPTASAAASQTFAECNGLQGTVLLDGSLSNDPDSNDGTNDDIVGFEWVEDFGQTGETPLGPGESLAVSLPLGSHEVTLVVTDTADQTDTDSVTVTVGDTLSPSGGITAPGADACFGPAGLPVEVTHDFTDQCDPGLAAAYAPPGDPSPFYSTHGDQTVAVSVTDPGGVTLEETVSFTIDTVPPTVTILNPTGSATVPDDLPLSILFQAGDDDGALGGVAHERILLDGCVIFDGDTWDEGNGLLSDDTVPFDATQLCRIAEECGFSSLVQPVLSVEATDACGGNVGSDSHQFLGSVALTPGLCSSISLNLSAAAATTADWDDQQGAEDYDVIRGDLATLTAHPDRIDVGPVHCVESDSNDSSTAGDEDLQVPAVGQAFFFLVQSHDGQVPSGFGRSSDGRDRVIEPGNGGCD